MAGTDITGLLEAVQKKINAVDSSASTGDLLRLLSAVRQSGTPTVFSYNGDEFPNLLDGTDDLQMLAYNLDSDKLYFQKDRWLAKVTVLIFQGTNFGYASGGGTPSATNVIDKFPFASDTNASDVGDLTVARAEGLAAGQSSRTHGYTSGGEYPSASNVIDKFPFATDTNASDVGDLTVARYGPTGQSSSVSGYTSGGSSPYSNVIDKFPFASNANASDVGDLTIARAFGAGQSSTTHGYTSGSEGPGLNSNVIDKFPFATDTNASDVGDLTAGRRGGTSGQSSEDNGYTTGGIITPSYPASNVIDKFPFASDTNASDVGDLTVARVNGAGQSSGSNGYTSGGRTPSNSNVVDKFPFASNANATDVGDLTVARFGPAGQQY